MNPGRDYPSLPSSTPYPTDQPTYPGSSFGSQNYPSAPPAYSSAPPSYPGISSAYAPGMPSVSSGYPPNPMVSSPYPPGPIPPYPNASYPNSGQFQPATAPYPQQPGYNPYMNSGPPQYGNNYKTGAMLGTGAVGTGLAAGLMNTKYGSKLGAALGTGVVGAGLAGGLMHSKKGLKKQRKMAKKALKYGLPIAGVGAGAYMLHRGVKKFGSSSSSSSSSSSEEE